MLKCSVLALCLVSACALSAASADDQEIESLQALPPLLVDVKVVAPVSAGIGESDLKAAVELRLRNSGIKVGPGSDAILAPHLFVSVTAPTGQSATFGVGVSLSQFVKPFRPQESRAPILILNTWHKDRDATISNGVVLIPARDLVEKIIDDFINDYLKA